MKNQKTLLLLLASGLLAAGCASTNPKNSTASSKDKAGTIADAAALRALFKQTVAMTASSIDVTYQETAPNGSSIQNHYEVKKDKAENIFSLTKKGSDTPLVNYQGVFDNVYYQVETGALADSATRKKIVSTVAGSTSEIAASDAEKAVQEAQSQYDLGFFFEEGEHNVSSGKLAFLSALKEGNTEVSFSSTLGKDGKESVHYLSYAEASLSYSYDLTLTLEGGKIESASLLGKSSSIEDWDSEKHAPKQGLGTEMSLLLNEVTYVDALPEAGSAPLLSNLSDYFISSIAHASFLDRTSGKEATFYVGDTITGLDVDAFTPASALDKATIAITSSSDEGIIGKGEDGAYHALKEGTVDLTLGNAFHESLYTMKDVVVNPVDTRPTLTVPETEGVILTNITAGSSRHAAGDTVSFYADPKEGYAIDHVYLVQGGNQKELTAGSQNLYTFKMPEGDCSLLFSVRKLEMVKVSYEKPSSSMISEFKVFYNPEGTYEEKSINSGSEVAVGTKVQIKLALLSGYSLKSITVSDGASVTTVTANKLYSFTLGSSDVTITFDIQADASTYAITVTKSNDYAVESMSADGKTIYANQRLAKSGQLVKATLYATSTDKSFAEVSIVDAEGGEVEFSQASTTVDDPEFDPDYDHGTPTQYPAVTLSFTMPASAVTITATLT